MRSTKKQTKPWPRFSFFQIFFEKFTFKCFYTKCALKTRRVIAIKNQSLIVRKNVSTVLCSSLLEIYAKFKVDRLSSFRTGAGEVFTTQKYFHSEILITMIPFKKHIF